MDNLVLVDTCVWASFFAKPDSIEKRAVDELIDADRVALIGPVVAEVLMGFRHKQQSDWVASRLRMAHFIEAGWENWRDAADLGRDLRNNGNQLPLTDLVLAVIAKRTATEVYTTDPHFDCISDLKRYLPQR